MALKTILKTLTILLHVPNIRAVDLGAPIVGCSEVDCPTAATTTSASCRVADNTLTAIGLANFQTSFAKDPFTWTLGVENYDNTISNRIYERNFYLGSPQGVNLNTTNAGACALFFTRVTDQVKFDGNNSATLVGTCNDALNADCVNALLAQATEAASSFGTFSDAEACERLQSDFTSRLVSQCTQFATGNNWQGVEVRRTSLYSSPHVRDMPTTSQLTRTQQQPSPDPVPQQPSPKPKTRHPTATRPSRKQTPSPASPRSTLPGLRRWIPSLRICTASRRS